MYIYIYVCVCVCYSSSYLATLNKRGYITIKRNTIMRSKAVYISTVWLYLLYKIKPLWDSCNVGLYKDDKLAIVEKANGPKFHRLEKEIISLFKDEGLSI